MEWIMQTVQSALHQNEFFSGGLVLSVIAGVIALTRRVPILLWLLSLRQITTQVEVRDLRALYWLGTWLEEHPYGKRCRRLKFRRDPGNHLALVPGVGRHLVRHDGRWYLFDYAIEEGKKGTDTGDNGWMDILKQEVLQIRCFGRQTEPIREIIGTAQEAHEEREKGDEGIKIYVSRRTDWWWLQSGRGRTLDSVILADGLRDDLTAEIADFFSEERRSWYEARGIPYRRGILLEGPPGNGKSSVVRALATEHGMRLYVLDLTQDELTDLDVARLLSDLDEGVAVLVEDIDCLPMTAARDSQQAQEEQRRPRGKRDSRVTLSGLLNALDGVYAGEGRIVFFTTNHPDNLDPALLRPGRVDSRYYLGDATPEQAAELWRRFHPERTDDAETFADTLALEHCARSMAAVQGLLIRNADDPDAALAAAGVERSQALHAV